MKSWFKWLGLALVAFLLPVVAWAQPPVARFYGQATIDGKPALKGQTITAPIEEKEVSSTQVKQGGEYFLTITQPEGQSYEGKTVSFRAGDLLAEQTGTWHAGEVTKLNLSFKTIAPTPTPAPTPAVEEIEIEGKIAAIDLENNKVTISDGKTITLQITEQTELKVWGRKPASINDLKVGDPVKAEYNPATMEALELKVGLKEPLKSPQGFFGVIKSITDNKLVLDTRAHGEVTLQVDEHTHFWAPHRKRVVNSVADLREGDRVAVLAERRNGDLIARRVLIIPPKPLHLQLTGAITEIAGNEVTIQGGEQEITMKVPPGIAQRLSEGDTITIVLLQTPGVEKPLFRGGIKGDELQEKLLKQVKKAGKGEKAQALKQAREIIQKNRERQREMLGKAREKAAEEAKEALKQAMERSEEGFERALKALEEED